MNNCAIKTESAQECQATCQNQEGCLEFTWIGVAAYDDEYPNMDNKHKCCHKGRLHSDDSYQITGKKKTHFPGLISGPKFCGGAGGKLKYEIGIQCMQHFPSVLINSLVIYNEVDATTFELPIYRSNRRQY